MTSIESSGILYFSPFRTLPADSPLNQALVKWAVTFKANVDWLKIAAIRTLRGWYVAPDWRESLRWHSGYTHQNAVSTGARFEFGCVGWETELVTWSAYSQSVRQSFQEALLEYEKSTRKLAENAGLPVGTEPHER